MAYNGYAIDQYLDAEAVTRRLDKLIKNRYIPLRSSISGSTRRSTLTRDAKSQRR